MMDELQMIEWLKRNIVAKRPEVKVGIGDDAAVIEWHRKELLVCTTDVVVEDVHFLRTDTSARAIGRKALAVNISDIAAMGGIPRFALVSLGIPKEQPSIVAGIYRGINSLAREFGVDVIGGNLSRSGILFVDIFLVGSVREEDFVLRSTASAGDRVFVTGSLGGSQKGKQFSFTPRVREARVLLRSVKPSAMMDISDGLGSDLGKLARASRCGCEIDAAAIPVARQVLRSVSTLQERVSRALYDGEDYELLFTVPERLSERVPKMLCGTPVVGIGRLTSRKNCVVAMPDGEKKTIERKEFQHFSEGWRK